MRDLRQVFLRQWSIEGPHASPYRLVQSTELCLIFLITTLFFHFFKGARPYKCDECGREFRQWGDLKYHFTSLHSGVRQYQWYTLFAIFSCVRILIQSYYFAANFVASPLRESIH